MEKHNSWYTQLKDKLKVPFSISDSAISSSSTFSRSLIQFTRRSTIVRVYFLLLLLLSTTYLIGKITQIYNLIVSEIQSPKRVSLG